MADQNYIVDIILKATDQTSAAMASVAAKLGMEKEALEDLGRTHNKYAQDWERANSQLNTSNKLLNDNMRDLNVKNKETVDRQVDLIKATRNWQAAVQDGRQSLAEFVQVQNRMITAQKALNTAYVENEGLTRQKAQAESETLKTTAAAIAQDERRLQIVKDLSEISLRNAQAEEAANQRREAEERRLVQIHSQALQEDIRRNEQRDAAERRSVQIHSQAIDEDIKRTERREATERRAVLLHAQALEEDIRRDERKARSDEQLIRNIDNQITSLVRLEEQQRRVSEAARGAAPSDDIHVLHEKVEADTAAARIELDKFAAEASLRGIHINVDLDTAAARAELALFRHQAKETGDDVGKSGGILGGLSGAFTTLSDSLDGSSSKIAAFDNLIRGAFTFLIASFLQPLIVLAAAAAGALLALASSALYAGGAVAGGFAAGLAQAIPVLGIFAAFVYRLKAVFDAATQAQLLDQQQSYKTAQQHKKSVDAASQLAQAHDQVATAQRALTEARRQAADQLEQLIFQERAAELAARGAVLSQTEAQQALQQAIASGGDVARAQLQVQESNLRVDQTSQATTTATRDRRRAVDQGVEGAPGVVAAKQQIENAQRSVDRAARSAQIADANITAAAGKLNFLLGRLSPAERRLFETVKQLQDVFRLQSEKIVAPMIDATDRMMKRVIGLLSDRRIVGAFRGLAGEVAKQMERLFGSFTDRKSINQFLGFIGQAKTNLKPLTDILINVGHIFLDIGQAAGPALSEIFKWLGGIVKHWREFTGSKKGQDEMKDFFLKGVKHLESWLTLLGSVAKLFLAIAGIGAGTGKKFVDDTTKAIDGLTDSINKGGKGAKFFHDLFHLTKQVIKDLGPVITSLWDEFQKTIGGHGEDSFRGFATFLADVLIPAFGRFIRNVGHVTAVLGDFAAKHPQITKLGGAIAGALLSFGLAGKAFAFLEPALKFTKALGLISGALRVAQGAALGFELALAPIAIPIILIAGAIVYLLARFHLLDDIWRGIKAAFKDVGHILAGPFKQLTDALGISNVHVKNFGSFLDKYIKPFFTFYIRHIAIPAIQLLIHWLAAPLVAVFTTLAGAISGVIDIFKGLFNLVDDIIHGNWDQIGGDLKEIAKGILEAFMAPFKGLFNFFKTIFQGVIQAVKSIFGIHSPSRVFRDIAHDIIDGLLAPFRALGRILRNAFSTAWDTAWHFLKSLPGKIGNLGKDIVNALINYIKKAPQRLIDGIKNEIAIWKKIGSTIIDGIVSGVKGALHLVENVFKGLKPSFDVDLNPIGGMHAHMKLGDHQIFETGGPVKGSGTTDNVRALLTPGEHIWTRAEVARAGGHQVMFALRRMFGGGGSGSGGRFAQGGPVVRPGDVETIATQTEAIHASASISISFENALKNLEHFNNMFRSLWRHLWSLVDRDSSRGVNDVIENFRNLYHRIDAWQDQIGKRVTTGWSNIEHKVRDNGRDLKDGLIKSFDALDDAVFRSLRYIGNQASDALKDFGAKAPRVSISAPPSLAGMASGGMVGFGGERGRDAVPTWLGRGEAVLNWAHQRYIAPAVEAFYGHSFGDTFKRVRNWHAGGMDSAQGYAVGKPGNLFDGHPGNVNAGVRRIIEVMKQHFPLVVSSTTDHSTMTTSGNISDHVSGAAVDLSGASDVMNRAASYVMSSGLFHRLKQGIHNPNLSVNAGAVVPISYWGPAVWGQHANHLHLAIAGALRGGFKSTMDIARVLLRGTGSLHTLGQRVVDLARNAAKAKIASATSDTDTHGGTIPAFHGSWVGVMGKIAQAKGWNLDAWRSLVSGESGGNVGIRNKSSGAFGLGQFLGATLTNYAKFGATSSSGEGQITAMAQYISDRYGNPTNAYRTWLSRNPHWYAMGGQVPGGPGQPVPIVAHAGEWVVNKIQQSKLAQQAGVSISKLRDLLGFSGGPSSFQGGGQIEHIAPFANFGPQAAETYRYQQQIERLRQLRDRAEDAGHRRRVQQIEAEIKATDRRHDRIAKGLKDEENSFQNIVDRFKHATSDAERRRIGLRQGVYVAPDAPTRADLTGGGGDPSNIQQQIRFAFNAIRRISSRHLTQPLQRLMVNLNALGGDNGLFAQLDAAIDQRATRAETDRNLLATGLRHIRRFVRGRGGIRRLLDSLRPGAIADPNELLEREQRQLGQTIADRNQERGRIVAAFNAIQARLRRTRRGTEEYQQLVGKYNDFVKRIDDIDTKIATDRQRQLDNRRQIFENRLDAALKPSQDRSKIAEFTASIAQTLGNEDLVKQANESNLQALREQQTEIRKALRRANVRARTDPAFQAIADKLGDDYRNITKQIIEMQAQALRDQMDAIDKSAERGLATLNLRGRAADIQERLGDPLGAIRARQGIAGERGGILQDERTRFQALQAQATAEGQNAVAKELAEKIADLDLTIQEQVVETKALSAAYRQAAIDAITQRVEGQTTLIGSAQQIVQKLGEVSGVTNTEALGRYLQGLKSILVSAATDIGDQINQALNNNEFVGAAQDALIRLRDAFTTGPQQFADTLAALAPNLGEILKGMTPEEQEAFNKLVAAMSNNTISTLDNTKSITDLNGSLTPQSFSSTAWQWFRSAIFTGMGDVLPQYKIPQMQAGGMARTRGIYELHPGEVVSPAQTSAMPWASGDTNVYITEPMEVADPLYLAKRIAWEKASTKG